MSAIDRFVASRRIVRADELGVIERAAALLGAAHREAQAARAAAREEAAAAREAAQAHLAADRRRGYQEGLALGRDELAAYVTRERAEAARRADELEERLTLVVLRSLERLLVDSAHEERFLAAAIDRVLRAVREEKHLVVHVASEQQTSARHAVDALVRDAGAPPFIEVRGEPSLARGACIVESSHGRFDASLQTQLGAIKQALGAVWREDRGVDDAPCEAEGRA